MNEIQEDIIKWSDCVYYKTYDCQKTRENFILATYMHFIKIVMNIILIVGRAYKYVKNVSQERNKKSKNKL